MRRAISIFTVLALLAVSGCIEGLNDGAGAPTLAPFTTPGPLPTAPTAPTTEPLPTFPPSPTITQVPRSSSDPIIGTWSWHGANNTMTTYYFMADGTFERHDSDSTQAYTGVWERQAQDTYKLIYNTPAPGIATETVTYHPSAQRMEQNQTYYTRV